AEGAELTGAGAHVCKGAHLPEVVESQGRVAVIFVDRLIFLFLSVSVTCFMHLVFMSILCLLCFDG
ncbi:MAG: hypothetical protein ACRC41_14145, partial [Sarcina sp.]